GVPRRLRSFPTRRSSDLLLTLAGVGLALGEKAFQWDGAVRAWVGELAVFLRAVSGAVCSVLYRPYLKRYPTLAVSAVAMLASVGDRKSTRLNSSHGSISY